MPLSLSSPVVSVHHPVLAPDNQTRLLAGLFGSEEQVVIGLMVACAGSG